VHISGLTLCRGMGQPRAAFNSSSEVAAVSGAAFMIRRDIFLQIGGFDDRYFLYMEDTDLSLRARLEGWRILYVPDALVYHDYKLCFGSHKIYYQERNRYFMLLKIYRFRTLLFLLPALVLAEFVTWGFVINHKPKFLLSKLKAYTDILSNWSTLIQARRRTQLRRKITDRRLLEVCAVLLSFEQTGETRAASFAHQVFDPLFHACHYFTFKAIHW
jgi:GT2 family glycosyltransferase